jgi:CBS domain-containing protein
MDRKASLGSFQKNDPRGIPMKVRDIMSPRVISVTPESSVLEAVRLMLQNHVSGLPVVDRSGALVGVVTEGDFLRRSETETERKRPRWLEFLLGPSRLADEYVHTHSRNVKDVMTPEPITIAEDAGLDEAVQIMEHRRIKRLPVVRDGQVVGIVSRANLLHALVSLAATAPPPAMNDTAIREELLAQFDKLSWAPAALVHPVVKDGVVELWGTITEEAQREALKVCAANIPGVKSVVSHLTWIEPMSGMAIGEPEEIGARR